MRHIAFKFRFTSSRIIGNNCFWCMTPPPRMTFFGESSTMEDASACPM